MPEGEPRKIELNRGRVDTFKQVIQEKQVFSLSGEERNQAAKSVIGELGISGVDTMEGMYEKTKDSSVNQQVAEQNILDLGTAIGECIMESGDEKLKDAVKSGSFSTEKLLPEAWQGRSENLEGGDSGLAVVICDSQVKVPNEARRTEIIQTMEWIDFCKNYPEFGNDYAGEVKKGVAKLSEMGRTSINFKEKQVIADKLGYLNSEKAKFDAERYGGDKSEHEKSTHGRNGDKTNDAIDVSVHGYSTDASKEGGDKKHKSRSGTEIKYRNDEFPRTLEGQLEFIEERLNIIEKFPTGSIDRSLALSDFLYPLTTMLAEGSAPEHILNIIRTRLSLREIGVKMANNSGSMGERGEYLIRAITDVEENGFDMSPTVMEYFFENKLGNLQTGEVLKTAEAWDLMEDANFKYQEMVNEVTKNGSEKLRNKIIEEYGSFEEFCKLAPLGYSDGTPLAGQVYNYWLEGQGKNLRAAIVREYLIERLMRENPNLTEYQAEKSMQLSEFMYDASLESCVVDWDFINGDEYAEAVNIGYLRRLDGTSGSKGKLVGPKISKKHVDFLTPGWIRTISKEKDPTKPIYSKTVVEKGLKGVNKGLQKKNLYTAHFISIIAKKIWPAHHLILNEETPLTKDVLKTQYFQKVNDYFNKVDSQVGNKGVTKAAWLGGLVELTLTSRDSTWSKTDFIALKEIVTKDIVTDEEGNNPGTFITEGQWKWIEDSLDLWKNVARIKRYETVARMFEGGKRR